MVATRGYGDDPGRSRHAGRSIWTYPSRVRGERAVGLNAVDITAGRLTLLAGTGVREVNCIQPNGSLAPHSRRVRTKAAPGVSVTPGIVAVASHGDHTRLRAVFTTRLLNSDFGGCPETSATFADGAF